MNITQAGHKAFLYQIVNLSNGELKRYPLDKLSVAMSTSKKLIDGSKQEDTTIHFADGEVRFSAEEWVFLKDTLTEVKEASLTEGEVIQELKALFDKE